MENMKRQIIKGPIIILTDGGVARNISIRNNCTKTIKLKLSLTSHAFARCDVGPLYSHC